VAERVLHFNKQRRHSKKYKAKQLNRYCWCSSYNTEVWTKSPPVS